MRRRKLAVAIGALILVVLGFRSHRGPVLRIRRIVDRVAVSRVETVPEQFEDWTSETRESDPGLVQTRRGRWVLDTCLSESPPAVPHFSDSDVWPKRKDVGSTPPRCATRERVTR